MGKLLASLAVIIVAATAALFSFTLISNATIFTTTYVHIWKDATGTNFANNQPGVSTAAGYSNALTFPDPLPIGGTDAVANFASVYTTGAPPSWKLAIASSVPITTGTAANGGIAMGNLTSQVFLGLFNGGCANPLSVPIDLFNATTDTTDTIPWLSDGMNLTGDTDPVLFPAEPANGVPAEADHYPEYLNTIFDVDGPNGVIAPLRPYARLYGQVTVSAGAPPTHLTLVVFNADQFQNMAGLVPAGLVNPQDDMSDSFGFVNYVILNNPTQPAAPSSVTDFCSQLISTTLLTANTRGELHLTGDNLCGNAVNDDFNGGTDTKVNDGCPVQGTPEEVTGVGPDCDDAVDDDGDGWVNDGCIKAGFGLATPGEQATECINNFADGADNDADTVIDEGCVKLGAASGPTATRGDKCDGLDNDSDGTTDEGCGIANVVTAAAGKGLLGTDTHLLRSFALALREAPDDLTPAHAGGGDGIENALDPCPLTDSGTWDPRSFGSVNDTDSDGMDDSCDPVIGTASLPAVAACGGAAGFADEDQDCFPNRGDNCPLVWNGDNPNTLTIEGQDDLDVPFGRVVGDGGNRNDGIGSACEMAVVASGTAEVDGTCNNATSDEGTDEAPVAFNDGCPQVGATSESNGSYNGGASCTNALNDDGGDDGVINDGCPQMGLRPEGDQCRGDPADGVGEGLDDDGDTVPDDGCNYDNDNDGVANEDPKNGGDDDGDGLIDEDPADDWDGDGSITDEAATPGGVTNRSQEVAQGAGTGADAANAKAMHSHKAITISAVCLSASADTDTDGWCDATETAMGSNPALAGSRPEHIAAVIGSTDTDTPPQVCNDLVDNDGDGSTDAADAGCTAAGGDADADGLVAASDNCDSAKNPDQLNTDADVETPNGKGGDECDIDDDGDTLVDVREYPNGTNPKIIDTDGDTITDRAELVLLLCNDAVDDDGDTVLNDGCAPSGAVSTSENPQCVLAIDNDGDGFVNDGCPQAGAASETAGAQCANAIDNDGDGFVNDGCVMVGLISEDQGQCTGAVDNDSDGLINDGCPIVGSRADNDLDGDGFGFGLEMIIGTNPDLKCTNSRFPGFTPTDRNLRHDAYGLDITRDGIVNSSDTVEYKGRSPSAVDEYYPSETNPAFAENRLDLDGSGIINSSDTNKFKGKVPSACTP